MVVWALVPATLAVGTVADLRDAGGMLAWHPGWMRGEESLTGFWLGNFGLMLPMTVWLLWKGLPRLNRFDRLCACFGAGLFLLCAWIRFAPWAWDNIKLMVWAYLLILPSLYRGLLAMRPLWQRSAWMFLLFFSGALALLNGLGPSHGYPLISRPELDGVAALLRDLPPGSRVAAVPTYNHPVLLNGQAVAAGYPGHLWSHGYDATASLADLQTLMTGGEGWRVAAARLRVEYIFWGPLESHTYGWIVPVWRFELPLERYSDYGELIRLPSLTTETPATGTP
jgi:hypothetical protein